MGAKLSIIYFLIGVARVTNLLHFKGGHIKTVRQNG